jgi:hypothetical protein
MITPIEEPEDVQEEEVIAEAVISSTSKSKDKLKFDFAVEDTDRSDLIVYTVSMQSVGIELTTLTILAPSYPVALELAGINKDNTVKVSEAPFEG